MERTDGLSLTCHIRTVEVCRELTAAIAALACRETRYELPQPAAAGGEGFEGDVSQAEAQVTLLVLKDIVRARSDLPAMVTPAGQRLLDQLQQALIGGQACRSRAGSCKGIMEAVYCSFSKARTVRDLAETIACEAVCNEDTCLALLPLALECRCSRLLARALQVAAQSFASIHTTDDFVKLPLAALLALLARDDLRVDSEKLVCWAVAGWIMWDRAERTKHLCQLIVEGVRLVHLDRDELAEVDVHPLVRADMDVTMLLAELFMAKSGVAGPLCSSPAHLQRLNRAKQAAPRRLPARGMHDPQQQPLCQECCEPCGGSLPVSPTKPAVTLRSTWWQGQAPPASRPLHPGVTPAAGGSETEAAAGAVAAPQAAGAKAGSLAGPAYGVATGGCLTFAPAAASVAAASMQSPGGDAVVRDQHHTVGRSTPSSTPRAQRSSKRQRRPSTPFHFAAGHRPMGLMALPTPSNWAVMAVEPCTAQPPVARALFAAVIESADDELKCSAHARPSEGSETTTLTDRAEALGAPQFPTLKHEMAVSPTAVACAAAAARPDHSWILAAVDAELDAERRHPPPAVSQSSAASRKRLHFA